MKNLLLEASSDLLSAKMARVGLDGPAPESTTFKEVEDNTESSVNLGSDGTYRRRLEAGHLFSCSETGIEFQVNASVTIEYELEYGSDYMKQIKENGYELVGPLFNITVKPGVVTSVHLPHYLDLEGLGKDKSNIKYGHFKNGKLHFKNPTKFESSYIVLENPTFSRGGVLFRSTSLWKKKSIPISGKVLLYFRVMSPHKEEFKEYRTHLYLVPCKRADLLKLDEWKKGFEKIDKPSNVKLIAGGTYIVTVEAPNAKVTSVLSPSLEFKTNKHITELDFTEINVGGSATLISLKVNKVTDKDKDKATEKDKDGGQDYLWKGEFTRADLEDQSVMAGRFTEMDNSQEHFVMKHREDLIQRMTNIDQILDDLLKIKTINQEDYEIVRSKGYTQEKNRELFNQVCRWGRKEQDVFYDALKKHNSLVIKDLEKKY